MESTFVIARRSKCHQNSRQNNQVFTSTESPPVPNESDPTIQAEPPVPRDPATVENSDAEVVLI